MAKLDLHDVLARKLPRGSKFIPGFAVRALERLIRADELNAVLDLYDTLPPQEFIRATFGRWGITYEAHGLDRIDPSQRLLFASNHPFGGMDGMMLADLLISHFGNVRVMVTDLLMHVYPLKELWLPVNTHGRQSAEYAARIRETVAGPLPVLTFPAGLCSRRRKGVVADTTWKYSFVKLAESSDRRIVPVYVEGQLSDRFYRTAGFRERTGMKFNAEMLLLPDEMIRQSGHHFRIYFGDPIDAEYLAAAGSDADKTLLVRSRVDELRARCETDEK